VDLISDMSVAFTAKHLASNQNDTNQDDG